MSDIAIFLSILGAFLYGVIGQRLATQYVEKDANFIHGTVMCIWPFFALLFVFFGFYPKEQLTK